MDHDIDEELNAENKDEPQVNLCPSCGLYPADEGGICIGCESYQEHTAI